MHNTKNNMIYIYTRIYIFSCYRRSQHFWTSHYPSYVQTTRDLFSEPSPNDLWNGANFQLLSLDFSSHPFLIASDNYSYYSYQAIPATIFGRENTTETWRCLSIGVTPVWLHYWNNTLPNCTIPLFLAVVVFPPFWSQETVCQIQGHCPCTGHPMTNLTFSIARCENRTAMELKLHIKYYQLSGGNTSPHTGNVNISAISTSTLELEKIRVQRRLAAEWGIWFLSFSTIIQVVSLTILGGFRLGAFWLWNNPNFDSQYNQTNT